MTQPICCCFLLPLPPLLPLKFSMPLLSNNLLAIFCHRRVFYFPHSFLSFFFGWWLKVRAGQNEHVADKGGEAQSRISCVVCSALPACSRECNASCLPLLLLVCPAAIKVDHKMASKALPAQKKKEREPLPLLMQLSRRT